MGGEPIVSAAKAILDMQSAFVQSMVLNAAVKLNIADIIAGAGEGATLTAEEIGGKLPTSSSKLSVPNLKRLLRYMVVKNIVSAEYGNGTSEARYGLTPLSKLLVSSAPGSLAPTVRMQLHKVMLTPWLYLDEAVLDGGVDPFEFANAGKDLWAVGKEDQKVGVIFNEAMACYSGAVLDVVLAGYEGFKDVGVVADVGGGTGSSLRKIIQYNPHIKGINFDLPNVVATAPQIPGVIHVGGNMFESVPQADAIYMKWILHDWTDEQCIQILKNCWKSLPEQGGKVVIVEHVVPPPETKDLEGLHHAAQMDLTMLAHTSGKERTALEWEAIFSAAGFPKLTYLRFHGGSFQGALYIVEASKLS